MYSMDWLNPFTVMIMLNDKNRIWFCVIVLSTSTLDVVDALIQIYNNPNNVHTQYLNVGVFWNISQL